MVLDVAKRRKVSMCFTLSWSYNLPNIDAEVARGVVVEPL